MDNTENMTEAEYRSAPGLNYSTLKKIDLSPKHFRHERDNGSGDSTAFAFGRAYHALTLEPEVFEQDFCVMPATIKQKRGKAWDEFSEENEGKQIISLADHNKLITMAAKVLEHPEAKKLLRGRGCEFEIPEFWEYRGHKCKSKIDFRNTALKTRRYMGDLKSTEHIEPRRFFKSALNYDYPAQAWYYQAANTYQTGEALPWYWIAQEKKAPYDVAVIHAPQNVLDYGKRQVDLWLDRLEYCEAMEASYREQGVSEKHFMHQAWPGVAPCIIEFELPAWASPDDDLIID